MRNVWLNTLAWVAAVLVALTLAVAAPTESGVMGRMPSLQTKLLDQRPINLPEGLGSDRTLALISFQRGHRDEVESWITGLGLRQDSSIHWVRMPVLSDPGSTAGRSEIEHRLRVRYGADASGALTASVVPVFTDRNAFVRSAGLNGIDRAYAVVLNRRGEVLARVEGQYDPDKAATLRETLRGSSL